MAISFPSNLAFTVPVNSSSIGGLSVLRLCSLNLVYKIKEKILPLNGYVSRSSSEVLTPGTQTTSRDDGSILTPYRASNNDWVYFNPDASNPALTGLLTVPTLSTTTNLAYVDYPNGTVYFSGAQTNNVTATYDYYTAYVQDGYPDFGEDLTNLDDIRIPLVSVDFDNRNNSPFTIGGGIKENRTFSINILANSDPQRNDIMDIIEQALRYDFSDTINYSYGFPINPDGDINTSFDRGSATRWLGLRFDSTSSRIFRAVTPLPEKFRHQGEIKLQLLVY